MFDFHMDFQDLVIPGTSITVVELTRYPVTIQIRSKQFDKTVCRETWILKIKNFTFSCWYSTKYFQLSLPLIYVLREICQMS